MEFKIKTEPVCIVCVTILVYAAATIVSIKAGVEVIAIIFFVSINSSQNNGGQHQAQRPGQSTN
jgi:hypothetical protein